MSRKKIVAVSTAFVMTIMSGCGTETKKGTPLAHHVKDSGEHNVNTASLDWEVDNGEGLRIHTDVENIYMQFDHSAAGQGIKNIQFIIDIDNNSSTGNAEEKGADFIVENGYLYASQKRDLWDWKEIGKVKSSVEDLTDTIEIPKSLLHYSHGPFGVLAEALDDKWQPVLYSPSSVDENKVHTKTVYIPR
ncbi:MAG: hypothetical protein DSZ05_07440 [Sulfurospirillum sp.]|nr:MAG: hypothetical protein DSZ05_07440 [Sulfurospirillum sp.]